jgi:membrane fusion protein (multidrug efflux system)
MTAGIESTDDAQVEGRVMSISARVTGQVLSVRVEDNQVVDAGDVLLEVDPAEYAAKAQAAQSDLVAAKASAEGARSALALTEKTAPAALLQAEGGMATASSSMTSAKASIQLAEAEVSAAESHRALAETNLKRYHYLFQQHAVPESEVDTREADLKNADAAAEQAEARLAAANAAFLGSSGGLVLARGRLGAAATAAEQVAVARAAVALAEARVQQAEASFKLAELAQSYTTVRAPRRGVVSRRSVEEGQMVNPDRPLLAIVPLDDVWIVANFKEDQLSQMRAGQPAVVRLDAYGQREFHGRLASIAGGTGARFALLPPDNATGNFVKVIQRVPVLIRLDDGGGVDLRPGMSANVSVRTRG